MASGPRTAHPPFTVVGSSGSTEQGRGPAGTTMDPASLAARDVDWSILMARAQAGNQDAYRRLFKEISPYVRSLAIRRSLDADDAEEAVQDVLLTVHAIRHTYDPTRPFGPWLFTIANRRIVDRVRRRGRVRSRETPLNEGHETFSAPDANIIEKMSDRRAVREALNGLPPAQRRAIEMLKVKEMSLKEASAATGTSIASLKVATHRAMKSLRRMLSNRSDES